MTDRRELICNGACWAVALSLAMTSTGAAAPRSGVAKGPGVGVGDLALVLGAIAGGVHTAAAAAGGNGATLAGGNFLILPLVCGAHRGQRARPRPSANRVG
jgi:hypothetical protein